MREGRLQAMAGPLLAWYDENKREDRKSTRLNSSHS